MNKVTEMSIDVTPVNGTEGCPNCSNGFDKIWYIDNKYDGDWEANLYQCETCGLQWEQNYKRIFMGINVPVQEDKERGICMNESIFIEAIEDNKGRENIVQRKEQRMTPYCLLIDVDNDEEFKVAGILNGVVFKTLHHLFNALEKEFKCTADNMSDFVQVYTHEEFIDLFNSDQIDEINSYLAIAWVEEE